MDILPKIPQLLKFSGIKIIILEKTLAFSSLRLLCADINLFFFNLIPDILDNNFPLFTWKTLCLKFIELTLAFLSTSMALLMKRICSNVQIVQKNFFIEAELTIILLCR